LSFGRTHPVFHVSLLSPAAHATSAGPAPIIVEDNSTEYEVESIRDIRWKRNSPQYLVSWIGYSSEHDQWLKLDNLKNSMDILVAFHEANIQHRCPLSVSRNAPPNSRLLLPRTSHVVSRGSPLKEGILSGSDLSNLGALNINGIPGLVVPASVTVPQVQEFES
jgi:hypothetical protein